MYVCMCGNIGICTRTYIGVLYAWWSSRETGTEKNRAAYLHIKYNILYWMHKRATFYLGKSTNRLNNCHHQPKS